MDLLNPQTLNLLSRVRRPSGKGQDPSPAHAWDCQGNLLGDVVGSGLGLRV